MAITSIKTGSSFTNLVKYDNFLGPNSAFNPSSYESIASVVTTAGQTSISFTSIPGTYKHLQIRGIARNTIAGTTADTEYLRFNSDSGPNYAYHQLYGNGSTVTANNSTTTSLIPYSEIPRNGTTASVFGSFIVDILDYASTTKNKTVRSFYGYDLNGSGIITLASGLWMSTAAITSINVNAAADTMAAGATFSLYGIKG